MKTTAADLIAADLLLQNDQTSTRSNTDNDYAHCNTLSQENHNSINLNDVASNSNNSNFVIEDPLNLLFNRRNESNADSIGVPSLLTAGRWSAESSGWNTSVSSDTDSNDSSENFKPHDNDDEANSLRSTRSLNSLVSDDTRVRNLIKRAKTSFEQNQEVWYTNNLDESVEANVRNVHFDDELVPYYVVQLQCGKMVDTVEEKIRPHNSFEDNVTTDSQDNVQSTNNKDLPKGSEGPV